MKFGIGYFSLQSPPHSPRPHMNLYQEMLEEVKTADEMGFDSAWLTEHHFLGDGYCPSLLLTAAAIGAVTKKIRIGTGVLLLPLHDPIRVAEDAAVADLISEGRLILGIGARIQAGGNLTDSAGRLKKRRGRMEEGIEILQKSWDDEPLQHRRQILQTRERKRNTQAGSKTDTDMDRRFYGTCYQKGRQDRRPSIYTGDRRHTYSQIPVRYAQLFA